MSSIKANFSAATLREMGIEPPQQYERGPSGAPPVPGTAEHSRWVLAKRRAKRRHSRRR